MATPPTPPGERPPKEIFLENLKYIERVIDHSCRNSKLSHQEAEDFGQHVKVKLMEDDYAVIRKFRGDHGATLQTYLALVIKRTLFDYRDHIWGKWRPSADAEQLGPVAILLEKLMFRDKHSFEEACEILRTNKGVKMSVAELSDLRAKLPYRVYREVVGEEPLRFEPAKEPRPDQEAEKKELEGKRRRVYMGLGRAVESLPTEDQLFVKMWVKFSIAEIARIQKVEQKPLYRRWDKILKALKKALGRQGVQREEIKEILGSLGAGLHAKPKKRG